MNIERMSFDEASRELGITEAELESLVAAGEIASVKDGDTLFFKKDVVRKFKKQRESEPTVLLADDEINLLEDDAVEEIDLLAGDDEGTTPIKSAAGVSSTMSAGQGKDDIPEISLDDDLDGKLPELDLDSADELDDIQIVQKKAREPSSVSAGRGSHAGSDEGDETLLNLDGILEEDSEATTPVPGDAADATMLDTDLLDLSGDADPFNADTAEETSAADLTEAGTLLRGGGARVMQMKRKAANPLVTVFLALAALVLILPLGILTNVIFASSQDAKTGAPPKDAYTWIHDMNIFQGPVESIADFFKPSK